MKVETNILRIANSYSSTQFCTARIYFISKDGHFALNNLLIHQTLPGQKTDVDHKNKTNDAEIDKRNRLYTYE